MLMMITPLCKYKLQLHACEKWLRGIAFGEVIQGERASPEGMVRRTNLKAPRSFILRLRRRI
jgi:hypothetical protein